MNEPNFGLKATCKVKTFYKINHKNQKKIDKSSYLKRQLIHHSLCAYLLTHTK